MHKTLSLSLICLSRFLYLTSISITFWRIFMLYMQSKSIQFFSNVSFFFSFFFGYSKKKYFKNPFNSLNNKISTKSSREENRQPQNLLSTNTTLSKSQFYEQSHDHLPSRWYTVLTLPFPDQKLARRDISTFGRHGFYQSRAGYFSEQPSSPL